MNWETVMAELEALQKGECVYAELSPLTQDALHGTMWGLNHRYKSVQECIEIDKHSMIESSITKIRPLLALPDIKTRRRQMPRCGVGFGTYGWKYDHKLIHEAVKDGVALIDTAEGYGYGRTEEALGKALHGLSDLPGIATKVRRDHMSSAALVSAAERSNKKLGVVPHYQLHFPHCGYSDQELGSVLVQLRRSGKIKSIGLGNCSVAMIESMQRFLSDYSGDVVHSVQVRYNLIDRRIESTLLPYCQQNGILVLAYSPLGQSFKELHKPVLDKLAKQFNSTPSQVALAWILRQPGVLPIPRTNSILHLRENIEAGYLYLSAEAIAELEEHYTRKE